MESAEVMVTTPRAPFDYEKHDRLSGATHDANSPPTT